MARRKDTTDVPALETLPYEAAIAELESIIDRIEHGEIGLEESLRQFERGEALVRRCDAILRDAEQKVESIDRARLAATSDAAADSPTSRSAGADREGDGHSPHDVDEESAR